MACYACIQKQHQVLVDCRSLSWGHARLCVVVVMASKIMKSIDKYQQLQCISVSFAGKGSLPTSFVVHSTNDRFTRVHLRETFSKCQRHISTILCLYSPMGHPPINRRWTGTSSRAHVLRRTIFRIPASVGFCTHLCGQSNI